MDRGDSTLAAVTALRARAVDPAALSEAARVDALVALQQLHAWTEAQEARLLAAMDTGTEVDRDLAATEVGVALRQAPAMVYDRLRTSHDLLDRLPETFALLEAGAITWRHAHTLTHAVRVLPDGLAARVEDTVLDRAPQQSVAAFTRSVAKAVLAVDPRTAKKRHEDTIGDRRVCGRPVGDGMGELWAMLPADGLALVMSRLNAEAERKLAGDERTMDQRRADALVALAEQGLLDGAVPGQHGRKPTIQVTVALETLLGLDELPGELDGFGPIPAAMARALAFDPTGTWRRVLTDPDGRMIDYSQEAYEPAQVLQDHLIARDSMCRFPGCARRAALRPRPPDPLAGRDDVGPQHGSPLRTPPPVETQHRLAGHRRPPRHLEVDQPHRPPLREPATRLRLDAAAGRRSTPRPRAVQHAHIAAEPVAPRMTDGRCSGSRSGG
jgi:uncharacterized protein DUF222